jgi:hypothetical protein
VTTTVIILNLAMSLPAMCVLVVAALFAFGSGSTNGGGRAEGRGPFRPI